MARYAKPETLGAALEHLAEGGWTPLAGATDFYPALGQRFAGSDVLDLSRLEAIRGIREGAMHWEIGAGTSWTALRRDASLPPAFDALKAAAKEVGSVQIQNRATLGGNLCNASPAADGVPALLVLDAKVELRSLRETRCLPLQDFLLGNRRTARAPDELLTAIRLPKSAALGASMFEKLGARRYLVISVATAAVRLACGPDGAIGAAAAAVGACSPVAARLPLLEAALIGRQADAELADAVRPEHLSPLSPIDDVRADKRFRLDAAAEIVRRALRRLAAARLPSVEAA